MGKKKMSLSDVPYAIRGNLGVELEEIPIWANRNISNAIQKLGDVEEGDSVVQILNDAPDQRKNRITTVGNQGGDAIRMSGDFANERDRWGNQTRWFNFCKEAWGSR